MSDDEHGYDLDDEPESTPAPLAEKKRKKKTHKKAPGAPKRAKSAYILFSCAKREEVKHQLPADAKVTEVMKRIAELWRALDDTEKAEWISQAEADKTRYEHELENYDGPLRVINKRQKKEVGAPKRAMSAFFFFMLSMRPKVKASHPDAKNVDISRMLGEEWNKMDEEARAPYHVKAKKDTGRYNQEMERFKLTGSTKLPEEEGGGLEEPEAEADDAGEEEEEEGDEDEE